MGSDKPAGDNSNVGGRLILRPGSSTPEIEPPSGGVIKPLPATSVAPTNSAGVLKTIIPAAEVAPPVYQYSDAPGDTTVPNLERSGTNPAAPVPVSETDMNGGSK